MLNIQRSSTLLKTIIPPQLSSLLGDAVQAILNVSLEKPIEYSEFTQP